MALDDIVLYRGRQYTIAGEAFAESVDPNETFSPIAMLALTKTEPASIKSITRVEWVMARLVDFQPSYVHYSLSEWYQGVTNGNG